MSDASSTARILQRHPPAAASRAFGGALLLYVLVLLYASLAPFSGWSDEQSLTLLDWPRYIVPFDVFINVVAYLPFGYLLAGRALRGQSFEISTRDGLRWWIIATLAGAALSLLLEFLQSYLPGRVSSPVDVLANAMGAAIGAMAVLLSPGQHLLRRAIVWRYRYFSTAPLVDWGLLLLLVWFVAQLNPAIPMFEAGFIAIAFQDGAAQNVYDAWVLLPQALGIALNVTAFALLLSVLLRAPFSSLLPVVIALGIGFGAKVLMASLLLKTPQLVSTLSPATVFGVCGGLLTFVLLQHVAWRWRCFWGSLFVFAGGVMAKLVAAYPTFESVLKLFNWPYGQLANFTGLTRWMNEIWPLLALLLLASMFVSRPPSSEQSEYVT